VNITNNSKLLPPKRKAGKGLVSSSFEANLIKHLSRYIDNDNYLAAFLVASQTIESIFLPEKILYLTRKLGIYGIESSSDKYNFFQKNLLYLALSHDNETFLLLEKFRKHRNDIVHRLKKEKESEKIEIEIKQFLKTCYVDILDNFVESRPVPVLELYSRGWNDFRAIMVKRIQEMKNEIKSGSH